MMPENSIRSRIKASPGYLYSLAAGCVGITFLSWGFFGALLSRHGEDPLRAMDVDGVIAFLLSFAIAFAMRLIFWPAASPGVRQAVRFVITLIFALSVLASVISMVLARTLPATAKSAWFPLWFSTLALFCQIGSVLWIARYRREGV